jgi:hypothetical protein
MTVKGPLPSFKDSASAEEKYVRVEIKYVCWDTTFTHGLPPDILDRAGSHAVDALDLVGADDGVLESASILNPEDRVAVAAFTLGALHSTTIGLHATIKGGVAADDFGCIKGDAALGRGKGEGEALSQVRVGRGAVKSKCRGGK